MLNSNAAAMLLAIATPVLVPIMTQLLVLSMDIPESGRSVMVAAWLSLGLAGFLWGTKHYLDRVDP